MHRCSNDINYQMAQNKAYEILLKYSDGELPINPFKIASKIKNIKLMTFTEFAEQLQKKQKELSLEEIKCQFESDRGFLKKRGKKKYILAYNEEDSDYVIKWTIFHELGHYFLGHLEEDENQQYLFCDGLIYRDTQEKEANYFAKHCCSPFPIAYYVCKELEKYNFHSLYLFKYFFQMSIEVSDYCSNHFNNHSEYYNPNSYRDLLCLFKNTIDEKIEKLFEENYSKILTPYNG